MHRRQYPLLAALLFTLAACSKSDSLTIPPPPAPEAALNKTVEVRIGRTQPFSETAFDHVVATVSVSVHRVSRASNQPVLVWDTLISRKHLREFPQLGSAVRSIAIPGMLDSKEYLQVNWNTNYRDTVTNYISTWARLDPVPAGVLLWQANVEL